MAKKKATTKRTRKPKEVMSKKHPTIPAKYLRSENPRPVESTEPTKAISRDTPVPFYLASAYGKEASAFWDWTLEILNKSRMATSADILEIGLLVEAQCQANIYRKLCFPESVTIPTSRGSDQANPFLIRLEVAMATIHKISCKFAMTPVDRSGRKDLEINEEDCEIQTIND